MNSWARVAEELGGLLGGAPGGKAPRAQDGRHRGGRGCGGDLGSGVGQLSAEVRLDGGGRGPSGGGDSGDLRPKLGHLSLEALALRLRWCSLRLVGVALGGVSLGRGRLSRGSFSHCVGFGLGAGLARRGS